MTKKGISITGVVSLQTFHPKYTDIYEFNNSANNKCYISIADYLEVSFISNFNDIERPI